MRLVHTIEFKQQQQFKNFFEISKINPNDELESYNNLSIFEKVISVPKSGFFIRTCVEYGSNFYQVN